MSCLGAERSLGWETLSGEEVPSVGCACSWDNRQRLRLFSQRRDKVLLYFVCSIFIYVLSVSHMSLGKLLAQSRITVPEKSGETLGVIRVALRSRGPSMRGFGRRVSFLPLPGASHILAPRTERSRSTESQPCWSSQGQPWCLEVSAQRSGTN